MKHVSYVFAVHILMLNEFVGDKLENLFCLGSKNTTHSPFIQLKLTTDSNYFWMYSTLTSRVCVPPHLHLTTSKVMVIVWRLRGNIIRTVLCIANVLPLQWAQLTKTVHTARLGL